MQDKLNDNFALKNAGYSNYEDTTNMARHRWYYYKEGFSPKLVEKAIETVGVAKDDLIIDPFNGSGTTTLTSSILGHRSVGIEINPFTSFLSEAKIKNADIQELLRIESKLFKSVEARSDSPLVGFSTFSKTADLEKWLFNKSVLNSFEGGWRYATSISSNNIRKLFKLALISSAMQNCNATKDGKCLRYRDSWKEYKYNTNSFTESLHAILSNIRADIEAKPINVRSRIIRGDSRVVLGKSDEISPFKLCITSPPYLNTFDYTDIYRPELFLGKFIGSPKELYNLRLRTVRSHVQAKWKEPTKNDFGLLYDQSMRHINDNKESLMHKNIPLMIQAYFEDMQGILKLLKQRADNNGQVWLVVSNSAYAGLEIPVDLIIGDIASREGWFLKEIGVLRYVKKRKTKFSPEITDLRESVVILSKQMPRQRVLLAKQHPFATGQPLS